MCMGHSAISTTSIAGKQPLFNLHRANLRGCSIHQGQLPTQCWRLSPLAVHCTRSDIGRWLCYESGCWLHRCTKGLTVEPKTGWSDCLTRPSTVRDPAVLSVQWCYSATLIFYIIWLKWTTFWSQILKRDHCQRRQSCDGPQLNWV